MKKSWDPTWERLFRTQEWGRYPPEELIRFIARNYYKILDRKNVRILDLGCGTGACSWYLAREGFSIYGVDGSKTAIDIVKQQFRKEKLHGYFRVGDIIKLGFSNKFFDCIIDVCSIQHNKIENIKFILDECFRVLKINGNIFSMVLSDKSKFNGKVNPLENKGYTYTFNRKKIKKLFSKFKKIIIETSERTDRGNLISHFVINAKKCKL